VRRSREAAAKQVSSSGTGTAERPPILPHAGVIGVGYARGFNVGRERSHDLRPRLGSDKPKLPGTGGARDALFE